MKNFLLSVALAVLGWMTLSNQASAATITIDPNPVALFSDSGGPNAAINNAYEFSFAGTGDGFFGALSLGISGLSTSICSDAACSGAPLFSGTTVTGPFGLLSLSAGSFTSLVGGTYYLVVSGLASAFGGSYLGALVLNVSAPAVPIPPALLLFVTALGGLGVFKWSRRGSAAA